jgi:hypothetical protein
MLGRRSFKTDESFLDKLAIGAIGARTVSADLQRQHHEPIELERGSMDYKDRRNTDMPASAALGRPGARCARSATSESCSACATTLRW